MVNNGEEAVFCRGYFETNRGEPEFGFEHQHSLSIRPDQHSHVLQLATSLRRYGTQLAVGDEGPREREPALEEDRG